MGAAAAAAPSFAGLMVSLAAAGAEPDWDIGALADDVAVLSEEGAQRNRESRRQPNAIIEIDLDSQSGLAPAPPRKPPQCEHDSGWKRPTAVEKQHPLTIVEADGPPARTAAKDLKRASITLRVTAAESAQLHARAAESGMTVSAYLRSCAFEVESLRAQVKDALAQMRKTSTTEQDEARPGRSSLLKRMAHLLPAVSINGRRAV
jgi:hypothetical protein